MAGGFSIKQENIQKFKNFVFRKFKNINEDLISKKPLLLDSVISPSAVNLDFYNKVNLLSPFGSGNPEPKFVIEDMKTVNGKIVGEKHIKSVRRTSTPQPPDGPQRAQRWPGRCLCGHEDGRKMPRHPPGHRAINRPSQINQSTSPVRTTSGFG